MKLLLIALSTLILFPATNLAPGAAFWETCNSMMSGTGWMMVPMMIMPLLLIALLILGVLALIKFLRK